ncbi:MAG: MG2 domain-containing protein [Planctomycetaceae bacterium]
MRYFVCTLTAAVLATSTCLLATTPQQDDAAMRQDADKRYTDNNYADAFELYRRLTLESKLPQRDIAQVLGSATICLANLNRLNEFDEFFEQVVATRHDNPHLLARAAQVLVSQVDHGGFLIAGRFERGQHRGGGRYVSAMARDRVRAAQLLLQAIALLPDSDANAAEKAEVYQQLANAVGSVRFEGAWKLQDLTDLEALPDFEDANQWGWGPVGGGNKGAPVDENGDPVFHQMPESWDAAKSDGERWRWALNRVVQADESRRSSVDLEWARFLQSQFGVSEQSAGPIPVVRTNADEDDQTPRDATTWNAHELPDNETIARLASGTKRFALPDEFNHVAIYKNVIERADGQLRTALESLISVRMNRHQYSQAAELLKRILELAANDNDRNNVQRRIDQILNNWVQFETTKVQPAGDGATLDIRYRNGSQITFTAKLINIDQLLADTKAYLQSRPEQLDHKQLRIEDIGHRLIDEGGDKYLGESVANWTLNVTPPDNHFDAMQTVTTPLQKAGAYWVTATMEDGNSARIVLWVADTAISRKRVEGGTMYFVADAVSGKPIARANLEFFGWQQERIGQPRQRQWVVRTSRFADRTDNDGLAIPSTQFLNPQFQWLTIARTDDGRMAYDGFNGVWNPQKLDELHYSPTKVFAVTDRPVYRPDHTVKFRLWVREPNFDKEDTQFANKPFTIEIRNPKGDSVFTKDVVTDRWAGADGEWTIPADATLGHYNVAIGSKVKEQRTRERNGVPEIYEVDAVHALGQGSFRVEEYRKPEFEVTVDAPDKPVKLGDEIQAQISARYYFGAPVTEATVHYKVERTKKDQRWYPVGRWDWLYSPGYWWFSPNYEWYPGWSRWGCWAPIPPWWGWNPDPPEVVAEGDAQIGPDGTYLISIDTAAALREHSDSDHNYNITAEVVDQSRRTIIGSGSVIVARDPFKVFVWTDRGHYQTGDTANVGIQARTPDGKGVQRQRNGDAVFGDVRRRFRRAEGSRSRIVGHHDG